jgi:homopolymeric O-antigen transport system ATP-binding protein
MAALGAAVKPKDQELRQSDIALSVRGMGKSYTIVHDQEKHITLAETILSRLKNPFRRLRTETFWALKDISFDINKGDVVGIIGRNGAGKSTLLKVLSRITYPTSGEVDVYGRIGSLLEVGTGFHPELTGRENIFLNGAILGMRQAEIAAKFDEIVAFAEVEKFLDTPVKRYSSGMYVRLAFAVAAHLEPEILIVDEVLAVGDAAFQKKCLGKMSEVAGEGRTVLFVSHNISAVRELCYQCLWLREGRLHQLGSSSEVTTAYLSDTLASPARSVARAAKCVLNRVELLHDAGVATDVLESREPWRIRVDFELLERLPAGVSIKVTNANDLEVFEVNEFIRGGDPREPGHYQTTIDLSEVHLAPGVYYLTVCLMAHYVGVYLKAENIKQFTVVGTLIGYGGSVVPFDVGGLLNVQPPIQTLPVPSGSAAMEGGQRARSSEDKTPEKAL